MKIPKLFQRQKKLQAAARSIPKRVADDYEESNMRLSSAFIVVLMLHIVAVGGIYAFNSIKIRQGPAAGGTHITQPPAKQAAGSVKPEILPVTNSAADRIQPAPKAAGRKPQETASRKLPETAVKQSAKDSGTVYTVAKGDNPVGIAKRFGVGYDELLKLNKIEDPKKLQIGQKLHIPSKTKSN